MMNIMGITIREYRHTDETATMAVFRRSITGLASRDYDDKQVRVWAAHTGSAGEWNNRRMAVHTWIAEWIDDELADAGDVADCEAAEDAACRSRPLMGFIDVDDVGYIDMLFVDSVYSCRGVASVLLDLVERFAQDAGIARLTVHASITARPFFLRHEFHTVAPLCPMISDVAFTNYLMARP
ncbi:GNAT family N-acetyltransferase [Bifidobacterium tissieri]|uniref:GNAT family N-acetyltransferase n=1 Tax=Bifidobacterium tissieri TaxID=1630162 RepID=A0A5M9ZTI3_9BIFI|nr:GNAT family N-acetyltransferase [Bifidobacterium tissieri]KAA8830795.1 GNAT family N-acetyltransferase [Bifidobacterium tissieri]KAA8832807.1 GNAT family N-acetyltransferase [Bifidobacterium tissieri]